MAPHDDGAARHLVAGLALPDVALASSSGGTVNLATRRGTAVLYVYPWTGRPGFPDPPNWDHIPGAHGSTPQTQAFRDRHADFKALGVEVFGLSAQSSEHHRELSARLNIPFALLSDQNFAFADALDLPRFDAGGVPYLKRLTLVIADGRIVWCFYPVHPPEGNAREVLDWLGERKPD
jgi:peroxiredoxin